MDTETKLKIAAQALEESIGGQAACLRAVELTSEALRGAVPADCDPSYTSRKLAEMVMSDCGHSTNNQRLLDRIAERIEKHTESVRAELEAAPQPSAQPTEPAGEPVAFVQSLDKPSPRFVTDLKYCTIAEHDNGDHLKYIPLYTRPAVPLSDERIDRAIAELGLNYLADAANNRAVLRELCRKAAHKIGGAE
jgi:hypothetical protein